MDFSDSSNFRQLLESHFWKNSRKNFSKKIFADCGVEPTTLGLKAPNSITEPRRLLGIDYKNFYEYCFLHNFFASWKVWYLISNFFKFLSFCKKVSSSICYTCIKTKKDTIFKKCFRNVRKTTCLPFNSTFVRYC